MLRLTAVLSLFGLLVLTTAEIDHDWSKAEWTGKSWLGRFESDDRQENWPAFVDAVDLPNYFNRGIHKAVLKIWRTGDVYHRAIGIPEKNFEFNALNFRLGEEVTINRNGTEVKVKFTEDGDKLVADVTIPSQNKHIKDVHEVIGDDLVKTYTANGVTAKRWFKREEPSLTITGPVPRREANARTKQTI